MWGQVLRNLYDGFVKRIIPTRVGTSIINIDMMIINEDHPHACGDKQRQTLTACVTAGSSPRVWGQESVKLDTAVDAGIIPTRVGTRLKKSRKIAVLQNQPLRFPLTFHRSFV